MWKPKLRDIVEALAFADVIYYVLCILLEVYVLVKFSTSVEKDSSNSITDESKHWGNTVMMIAIKLLYFIIMYSVIETALGLYLLHAIRHSILDNMKRWIPFGAFFTLVCITDFISSLHAANFIEDANVTIGIVIKIPTLILVWKYIQQLESNHGQNLVNQTV